jgi:S-ribosylhomocysteine lyase
VEKIMNLIPSFQVDHTKIVPGVYVSRKDEIGGSFATTFDVRMKRPNLEPAIHPNAMHTIEHIVATFLRNDAQWRDRIVYWGPMGCLTGCYLIVKGDVKSEEITPLLIRAFSHAADFKGEVPGATAVNCGNFLLHDLPVAKYECALYRDILKNSPSYAYPSQERVATADGMVFYDS